MDNIPRNDHESKVARFPMQLDDRNPAVIADRLLQDRPHLIFWCEDFYEWQGAAYRPVSLESLKAWVWRQLGGLGLPPRKRLVAEILEGFKANRIQLDELEPGQWLSGEPAPVDLLPVSNGLVAMRTGEHREADPRLFMLVASPVAYDPGAQCPKWLEFVESLFPGDADSHAALQEWMGLMLSRDTSHQKIGLLIGPPRAGKGVIQRICTELVGPENVATPSLSGITSEFGLESLVGKTVALVSDARLGQGRDQAILAERLLNISGEDRLMVSRKYRQPMHLRLQTRFWVAANEMPRINDVAGALPNRFYPLKLERSWLGKEDPDLQSRLRDELPGILNWCIEGYQRLAARGRLVPTAQGRAIIEDVERLANPVAQFAEECLVLNANETAVIGDVFQEWKRWAEHNGISAGSTAVLSRNLKALLPSVETRQRRHGGKGQDSDGSKRLWVYVGLGLKRHACHA